MCFNVMDSGFPGESSIENLNRIAIQCKCTHPLKGLAHAREAVRLSEANGNPKDIAYSHLTLGLLCHRVSEYREGILSALKARELFVKLRDRFGEARALNLIGIYHVFLSNYEEALENYSLGLEAAAEIGNPVLESQVHNNIANLFFEQGRQEEALRHYHIALNRMEGRDHKETLSALLGNIGLTYQLLGQLPKALVYFRRSLRLVKDKEGHIYEGEAYHRIGEIYLKYGRPEEAAGYFQRSLALSEHHGNKPLEADARMDLGTALLRMGKIREGLENLEKALEALNGLGLKKQQAEILIRLSEAYEKQGDDRKALEFYKQYASMETHRASETLTEKMVAVSARYDLEKTRSEEEIIRLRNVELKKKAEELDQSYANLKTICDIGVKITSTLDLDKILDTLYDQINAAMDAPGFGVGLLETEQNRVEYLIFVMDSVRTSRMYRDLDDRNSLASWCIRNKSDIFSRDFSADYHRYRDTFHNPSGEKTALSLIYCLLKAENNIIGLVTVQSYQKEAYTESHFNMVKALASYVAIALNNAIISEELKTQTHLLEKEIQERKKVQNDLEKANRRLEILTMTDPLTGIPNRRGLNKYLSDQWKQSMEESTPLSFYLLDIDHFKQYNDTNGHVKGDQCLRIVSQTLLLSARDTSDFTARFGGEEFIMVLARMPHYQALLVAERLRSDIEKLKLDHRDSPVSRYLTVSVGVATAVPSRGIAFTDMIVKADEALYLAKNNGRNCVKGIDLAAPSARQDHA